MLPHNEVGTRASGQERNPRMNTKDFQHLPGAGKESWGHEDQPKRHLGRAQLVPQILGPLLEARLLEVTRPMCRGRKFIAHTRNLTGRAIIANANRDKHSGLQAKMNVQPVVSYQSVQPFHEVFGGAWLAADFGLAGGCGVWAAGLCRLLSRRCFKSRNS